MPAIDPTDPTRVPSPASALPVRWTTVFLDLPADAHADTVRFWCEVTGSQLSEPRGVHAEFATLLPPSGTPWLRVQRVGHGSAGTHLDLHVDLSELGLDDAAGLASSLGAVVVEARDDLVTLRSPGGYPLCLVGWDGEARPPLPVTLDGGGANRADQLCLDIPPETYANECAFWAALTGWPLRQGSLPAFRALDRPDGQPVRLLLQRREVAADGDPVTGHLDLACDDRDALTPVHERAGAVVLERFSFWTTLRDPAGCSYCLTPRDPRTGRLPGPPS